METWPRPDYTVPGLAFLPPCSFLATQHLDWKCPLPHLYHRPPQAPRIIFNYYFLLCYGRKPHTLKRSKQSLGPRAAAVCLLCRWGCGFLSGDNNREGDVNTPWSKGRAALHPAPRYSALARLWFPRNPEVPNAALLVQFLSR